MTVDTADILLKAAEDVQSGMWCKGAMFRDSEEETSGITVKPGDAIAFSVEQLARMKRCAVGSIALAVMQLGGTLDDYHAACQRAANWIEDTDDPDIDLSNPELRIIHFNDYELDDDPFTAGQELAGLFRLAGEAL